MHCMRELSGAEGEIREEFGNLFQKANTMMEESTINPLIIMNCFSFILIIPKLPTRLGPLKKPHNNKN